jgi:hypothetical protein
VRSFLEAVRRSDVRPSDEAPETLQAVLVERPA